MYLISLTPYRWQYCVSNFRAIKKEWLCKISCRINNSLFDILQEILQSHLFWMLPKSEMQSWQYYRGKRIKSVFVDVSSRTRFGHLFYTSSRCHFFDKTDLEQYFFKVSYKSKKGRRIDPHSYILQFRYNYKILCIIFCSFVMKFLDFCKNLLL